MKKNAVALLIILVVIIAGGAYVLTRNNNDNDNNTGNSTDMSNMDMSQSSTSSTTPQATNTVTIQNFAFSPADITVKAGTKVTWTNQDSTAHTVTETDGQSGPNSGDIEQGQSYSFTFAKAGTYHYHCSIHSEMVGTVTVTE